MEIREEEKVEELDGKRVRVSTRGRPLLRLRNTMGTVTGLVSDECNKLTLNHGKKEKG